MIQAQLITNKISLAIKYNFFILSMKANQIEICPNQAEYFREPLAIDSAAQWKAIKIVKIKNSEEQQISTIYKTSKFSQRKLEELKHEINLYESVKTSKKYSMSGVCLTPQGIAFFRKKDKNFMSLKTLLQDKRQFDFLKIFTSATEGISILHQSGIIHKDLNLDSIFSNGKALLRIDFPLFTAVEKQQRRAGYFQHANGQNICYSPELRRNQGFSFSSDIWALGIIFLQVLIKQIVGDCNPHQLNLLIQRVQQPYLKFLIQQMLHFDPLKRPNIQLVKRTLEEGKYIKSQSASLIKILTISFTHSDQIQKRSPIFQSNIKSFAKKKFSLKKQSYTITVQLLSECQMLIYIESEFLNKSIAMTISNKSMPLSLKKYFTSVTQLYPYLFSGSKYLVLNDSGQVQFYHSTEKCLQMQKKIEAQCLQNSILQDDLPFNCVGKAKILSQTYSGSLIGPDLLLLPAQALYNHQKQKQTTSTINFSIASNFKSTGFIFNYPREFQVCTEGQRHKYNYGLVFLEEKISRSNTITLLYDYSEQIILNKISLLNFDIKFTYLVGKHQIDTSQIAFNKDKVYFKCESSKGDLIFIRFSNGRVAAIGMVTAEFQGYLFSEEIRQNLLAWLFENKYYQRPTIIKHYQCESPLRIFPAKSFDFIHQEVPFTFLQNVGDRRLGSKIAPFMQTMVNQRMGPRLVNNFGNQSQAETILSSAIIQQSKHSLMSASGIFTSSKPSDFMKILRSYQYELGQNCWKTSVIYYWIGKVYQQNNSQRASYYFKRAIQLQQENQWNPLILLICYFQLGISSNQEQAKCFDQALNLSKKYHDYLVEGQIYRRYGRHFALIRQYSKCIQNYEAAILSQQKGENNLELINTLNQYIQVCLQLGKFLECAKSIQKMPKITKMTIGLDQSQVQRVTEMHWTNLIMALANRQTISAQVLETVKRIKSKYYPQSQLLNFLGHQSSKDNLQQQIN